MVTSPSAAPAVRAVRFAPCHRIVASRMPTIHLFERVANAEDWEALYRLESMTNTRIRNEAGVATMCVGAITTADQVNTIVAAGRADLVALARPHLVDPFFTLKAAAWYGVTDIHCPPQYLAGRDQIFRNSVRDRADLTELKRKAKPKGHATPGWKQAAE